MNWGQAIEALREGLELHPPIEHGILYPPRRVYAKPIRNYARTGKDVSRVKREAIPRHYKGPR